MNSNRELVNANEKEHLGVFNREDYMVDNNHAEFKDKDEDKMFIYKYNSAMRRKGKITQSNAYVLNMICVDKKCEFSFKVAIKKNHLFAIKQMIVHSCSKNFLSGKSILIAEGLEKASNSNEDL